MVVAAVSTLAEGADAVRVRTRAADGAVELGLADVAWWALRTVASVGAIAAAWNSELKAHVGTIEAHTHCGLLTGIERGHAIHHGLGKGRALGSVIAGRSLSAIIALLALAAVIAARDVEGEAHVRSIKAHAHGGRRARVHRVHRIHHRLRKGRPLLAHRAFLPLRDFKGEVQRVTAHRHIGIRRTAWRQGVRAVHLRRRDGRDVVDEHKECLELVADHLRFEGRVRRGEAGVEGHGLFVSGSWVLVLGS